MANLKEIVEGSIDNIALETIDENTYYNIDMADGGITNAQMTSVVAHPELFNVGDVYMCVDSGTYTENHFYKFTGSAWTDVTTEWAYPMLTGASDPTTATEGLVNQLYRNTTSNELFVCTAITSGTPNTYTWEKVGGGGLEVLTGASAPTSATVGELGQLYITTSGDIYLCTAASTVYTWTQIATKSYVDSAIASAVTTALNTPV